MMCIRRAGLDCDSLFLHPPRYYALDKFIIETISLNRHVIGSFDSTVKDAELARDLVLCGESFLKGKPCRIVYKENVILLTIIAFNRV